MFNEYLLPAKHCAKGLQALCYHNNHYYCHLTVEETYWKWGNLIKATQLIGGRPNVDV